MSVTVIGSANADLVVDVERRPLAGETVMGSDLRVVPGGKGANQAVAAALMGATTRFYGCVGSDANGRLLCDSMASAGVDISAVEQVEVATGTAMIQVTGDGENSIVVSPGANRLVDASYLDRHPEWATAALVVMQLEVPLDTLTHAAARCRELGVRFILNAAPAAAIDPEVLATCDPLVVNETEAALVSGAAGQGLAPRELAELLIERGARSVVVTLGEQGSIAVDPNEGFLQQDAMKVRAVDTTGAGDAFVGALAATLAGGGSLAEALGFGTRVSALVVQRPGAQTSYPSRDEVGD